MTAEQLNDAIQNMHSQNKFKQMVLYIEACESGSMFNDKLPSDINGECVHEVYGWKKTTQLTVTTTFMHAGLIMTECDYTLWWW